MATLVASLLLAAACRRDVGSSRWMALTHGAELMTQYDKDAGGRETARHHVLFVPQWNLPAGGGWYSMPSSSGGSVADWTLQYGYESESLKVKAKPLQIIDGETLVTPDRNYDLAAGNVFVAAVDVNGTVRVTQIPGRLTDTDPRMVLAHIKRALPAHPRVQAITLR